MTRILLIVDDDPVVVVGLRRYLRRVFDQILTAATAAETKVILENTAVAPSHLVCDYREGARDRAPQDMVLEWRREFPSISIAVALSDSAPNKASPPPGFDAIFSKPLDLLALREFLAK